MAHDCEHVTDFQSIYEKIARLEERVTAVATSVNRNKAEADEMEGRVETASSILRAEFGENGTTGNTSQKLQRIYEAIEGNGKPGLFIRMDRIEQVERRRAWSNRAITVAILTCVFSTLAQIAIVLLKA